MRAQRTTGPRSYQIARRQDFCGAFWSAPATNIRPSCLPPDTLHRAPKFPFTNDLALDLHFQQMGQHVSLRGLAQPRVQL
jgi:hypothetical protein